MPHTLSDDLAPALSYDLAPALSAPLQRLFNSLAMPDILPSTQHPIHAPYVSKNLIVPSRYGISYPPCLVVY